MVMKRDDAGLPQPAKRLWSVPIDMVDPAPAVAVREKVNDQAVVEYAERDADGEKFAEPAWAVAWKDHPYGYKFFLADGRHRMLARQKNGAVTLECQVWHAKSKDAARDLAFKLACGANAFHGLRRTSADMRRAVELALLMPENAVLMDRPIARLVRVNTNMIRSVRDKLTAEGRLTGHAASGEHRYSVANPKFRGTPKADSSTLTAADTEDAPVYDGPAAAHDVVSVDGIVRDEKGRPVPENLLPVFVRQAWGRELGRLADRLTGLIEEAKADAAGPPADVAAIEEAATILTRAASELPAVVCSVCRGAGTFDNKRGNVTEKCSRCKGQRGWLSRGEFSAIPGWMRGRYGK